jgi:hypothetical protein
MQTQNENFHSPIFGETRHPTVSERDQIAALVETVPVAVFQALNIKLNKRGLLISIDTVPDEVGA